MKKKLLFIVLPFFMMGFIHAQHTWDFANDTDTWPLSDGIPAAGGPVLVDNLAIYPHSSSDNMAQVEGSSSSFDDGFTGVNRFKLNGGGGADPTSGEYVPEVRYLRFAVTGPCDITVWCRSGGSSERTLYVTDGSSVLGEQNATDSSTYFTFTASYTGGEGQIYIFGSNNFSLYKIEVSANLGDTSLSVGEQYLQASATVKAIKNTVHISDVKSETKVQLYNITGVLVQSVTTSHDTSFNVPAGLYIARITTAEGERAVKLIAY